MSVPAMFVIDDTSFSHSPCGHATLFYLDPQVRVVREDGTRADTGALTLGRRVSVYVTEDAAIAMSCPPKTTAAKVILH